MFEQLVAEAAMKKEKDDGKKPSKKDKEKEKDEGKRTSYVPTGA